MSYRPWLALGLAAVLYPAPARAIAPRVIPFQARVTDAQGQPMNGSTPVVFTLYDGDAAVWSGTQTLNISNGALSARLGSVTPFPDWLAFDRPYTVGVKVGADPEMTPRLPLGAAPYALALPGVASDGTGRVSVGGAPLAGLLTVGAPGVTAVAQTEGTSALKMLEGGSVAQSFTLPHGGMLTGLDISMSSPFGHPWSISVALYANATQDGSPLAVATASGSGFTTDFQPLHVAFSPGVSVQSETPMSFSVQVSAASSPVELRYSANDPYPNGVLFPKGGTPDPDGDLAFSIILDTPPSVEIAADGKVGVGLSDPESALVVAGTGPPAGLRNGVHLGNDTGGQAHIELVTGGGTPYIDFNDMNAVDHRARIILNANGALHLQATTVQVDGALVETSDGRLKTDVQPVDDALRTVMELQGVTYAWKQDANRRPFPKERQVGFIAQDVERVLPEVVATGADGEKAVAYQHVVPVLVEAIKQQQREIARRDARIAEQERRLRALDARLRALEDAARAPRDAAGLTE